jgi:uncharacterized protein with HEPN domain
VTNRTVSPDLLRLKDIWQAISDIESIDYCAHHPRKDLLAVAYSIAVIGEASSKLSSELKLANPHIPWRDIIGMRHKIVHEYGKLDPEIVAAVASDDIPLLKTHIEVILKAFK